MATNNPLFHGPSPTPPSDDGVDLFADEKPAGHDQAAELIRGKLDKLYEDEPDAKQEIAEAKTVQPRSKHQEYMYRLSTSGKSLADIQTEWHTYYESLPDAEKHVVWQEFYDANQQAKAAAQPEPAATAKPEVTHAPHAQHLTEVLPTSHHTDKRNPADISRDIRHTARAGGKKLTAKHHFQAIAFGLAVGGLSLLIFLFSFFNEVVVAPFIQPSRSASATPIIIGTGDAVASGGPKVIIPKINVEIPLDFAAKTTDDATIEEALDRGVVHYPTTVLPGQQGNASFFGHSSNNLFNKGKYKFAFVLLHQLVPGDTFYLTYNNVAYAYQVFDKKVVPPSQTDVLNPVAGQSATATLITCDPPGTSLNRLVVWGKQVSPDPAKNVASDIQPIVTPKTDPALPGNGRTLWGRIIDGVTGLFH